MKVILYYLFLIDFLKEVFIGDTHEYPSPWFVNYLTLEEANEFIKEYKVNEIDFNYINNITKLNDDEIIATLESPDIITQQLFCYVFDIFAFCLVLGIVF